MASRSQPEGAPKSAATEASPSAAMKPSEVLSKAADLIEPEGAWMQGAPARRADGSAAYNVFEHEDVVCFCALGAIQKAAGSDPEYEPASEFFRTRILRAMGRNVSYASWNDAPVRTQAEVVAKLREAADLARSEGQ